MSKIIKYLLILSFLFGFGIILTNSVVNLYLGNYFKGKETFLAIFKREASSKKVINPLDLFAENIYKQNQFTT